LFELSDNSASIDFSDRVGAGAGGCNFASFIGGASFVPVVVCCLDDTGFVDFIGLGMPCSCCDILFFSGDLGGMLPTAPFFLGDLRRLELVPVAINGVGARMALSSGSSSSDKYDAILGEYRAFHSL